MRPSNLTKRLAAAYTFHREFTEIVTNAQLPVQGNAMVTLQFVKGSDLRDPTRDTKKWHTLVTQLREKVTDNGGSNNVENAHTLIVGMLKSRMQEDQLQPDGPPRANDRGASQSGSGAKGGSGGGGDNSRQRKNKREDSVPNMGGKVQRTAGGRGRGDRGTPTAGADGGRRSPNRVSIMLECGEQPCDGCKLQKHQNPNLEGPAKSRHSNAECKVQHLENSNDTQKKSANNCGGGGRGQLHGGGGRGGGRNGGCGNGGRGNGAGAQSRDKGPISKASAQK